MAALLMENETQYKAHALLGASSSHRWLECTPSAVAESKYPDKGSDYAREGSLAHAMCSRELKRQLGRPHEDEDAEIAELHDRYYDPEMEEHVAGYVNYVMERYQLAKEAAKRNGAIRPDIFIEQRLDFSDWVPDGFGTGDCVIVSEGMAEVIDFKYGKGVPVSAKDNPQMKLYALGAGRFIDYIYDIDTVVMTIYQPRIGNLSTWSIPGTDLLRWAEEELRPLAMLASKGKGVRSAGDWCRFCKAKGDCPRLASESMDLYAVNPDADDLSPDDFAFILPRLDMVSDWVNAVKERSLALAVKGTEIPGYKVVEGRSVRKITDPQRLIEALSQAGYAESAIFKPRELLTISALEKTVGRKQLKELGEGCITKPPGKPTLVADEDKRNAMDPANDFNDINL